MSAACRRCGRPLVSMDLWCADCAFQQLVEPRRRAPDRIFWSRWHLATRRRTA